MKFHWRVDNPQKKNGAGKIFLSSLLDPYIYMAAFLTNHNK